MKLFNKLVASGTKLFNKLNDPSNNTFRKVINTARKADNTIAKVGHFITNTANDFGLSPVAEISNRLVNGSHTVRKNLTNTLNSSMGQIRGNSIEKLTPPVAEPDNMFV